MFTSCHVNFPGYRSLVGWNLLAASCQDVQALAMQVCLERQEILGKEAENYQEMRWVKVDIQNYVHVLITYNIGSDTVSQDVRHDFQTKFRCLISEYFRHLWIKMTPIAKAIYLYIYIYKPLRFKMVCKAKACHVWNSTACLKSNLRLFAWKGGIRVVWIGITKDVSFVGLKTAWKTSSSLNQANRLTEEFVDPRWIPGICRLDQGITGGL